MLGSRARLAGATVILFVLGVAAGSATYIALSSDDEDRPSAAAGVETVGEEEEPVVDPDPGDPCASVPPVTDESYLPDDFVRQDEPVPDVSPSDLLPSVSPTEGVQPEEPSENPREGHELWRCNPEPGLYVFLDATTGEIYDVTFVAEERAEIGEAIRADFESRIQSQFLPVNLPSEVQDECDPSWQSLDVSGVTICLPEGWTQSDIAGPDYLVVESPDGSADVLVSLIDQPGVGVRGCHNGITVTAGSAVAIVCSALAEDFEPPAATLYGFSLNSGLYVQIRSESGIENQYFDDALIVAMNVEEGGQ